MRNIPRPLEAVTTLDPAQLSTTSDEGVPTFRDLVRYFQAGAKPRAEWRVGIEHEKIAVFPDGDPVPWDGPAGVAAVLEALRLLGFSEQREDGNIIALRRGDDRVTVEPGGQLELSGAALPSAVACRQALLGHLAEVTSVAAPLGIRFLRVGMRPFGSLDDVPWIPKRRYRVMRSYLPGKGRLAHEMMKRTATVQANFDYSSEEDATDKMRTAAALSSVVTALYACSSITDGRPNGYKSYRAAVWLETDEDRCGLQPFVFNPGFSFDDYVSWALDVPMFFVVRAGEYRPAGGITFRRFLREGFEGERATMADWEVHLSTLFPEVRLKRYIELRGADAGPLPFVGALAALWRGVLEDEQARREAWALVARVDVAERLRLRAEVPRAGLAARLGGRPLAVLALELVRIAADGLGRIPGGTSDVPLLEPLEAYAADGRSPADDMLDDYAELRGEPRRMVERWTLSADPDGLFVPGHVSRDL